MKIWLNLKLSAAILQIKKQVENLKESDLGFGLRLWDRFYDRPKFRGLHIYRTSLLGKAISMIPSANLELRPESFTKQKLKENGHAWRNDMSNYVAGVHDYYQKPDDIYYKFLVRSKRSEQDLKELKQKFRSSSHKDFAVALKGIEDWEKMTDITNNKFLYKYKDKPIKELADNSHYKNPSIDWIVVKKLINYYRFNRLFWSSI